MIYETPIGCHVELIYQHQANPYFKMNESYYYYLDGDGPPYEGLHPNSSMDYEMP